MSDKNQRLAAALRENLRRRKAQARDQAIVPAKSGTGGRTEDDDGRPMPDDGE